MKKSILITGGAGFIGSSLAHQIQSRFGGYRIVVFDKFRDGTKFRTSGNQRALGHFKNLIGFRGDVIVGDLQNLEDLEKLEKRYNFDVIFHQGAISDTTVIDQNMVLDANLNSFHKILDISKRMDATLVYASSAGVYGNSPAPNRVGFGEIPENVYGFSKLMMDRAVENFDYDKVVGLRYFNVYGEREEFKESAASMIFQLSQQILKERKVRLFKHGEQKRDFVYISDVIKANILAMENPNRGVYNIGSGEARTFNEVVRILSDNFRVEPEIEYIDNPHSFYQNYTEADIQSAKANIGYRPRYSLEKGIKQYALRLREVFENR
jgi:ADP-L-glycero-D-manno-heptose 6-epimerase